MKQVKETSIDISQSLYSQCLHLSNDSRYRKTRIVSTKITSMYIFDMSRIGWIWDLMIGNTIGEQHWASHSSSICWYLSIKPWQMIEQKITEITNDTNHVCFQIHHGKQYEYLSSKTQKTMTSKKHNINQVAI